MANRPGTFARQRWFVAAFISAALAIAGFAVPTFAVSSSRPDVTSSKVKALDTTDDVDSGTTHPATTDPIDKTTTTTSGATTTDPPSTTTAGPTTTSGATTTAGPTTTAGGTTTTGATITPTDTIKTTGPATGSFEVTCLYSHSKMVDPIKAPGVVPFGHRHDFFGATTTDETTTQASLDSSPTTCKRPQDHSGYWTPSVIRADGTYDVPSTVHIYYNGENRTGVQPIPHGLKMIAGNSKATGPQSTKVVAWQCSDNLGSTIPQATVPDCGSQRNLKVLVRFQECWDGVHLDSPDHQSHVAYYDNHKNCPAGWVQIVAANAEFKYPDLHNAADVLGLSSGSIYTIHGDFWNAWEPAEMFKLVSQCTDAGVKCGGSKL